MKVEVLSREEQQHILEWD